MEQEISALQHAMARLEDPTTLIPPVAKYYAASRIYSAVERCFAHWENIPEISNAELYFDYLGALEDVEDRRGFLLATQNYLARLKNAHTHFIDFTLLQNSGFGFWARPLPVSASKHAWTVCGSTRTDIKAGDIIEQVNNLPANEFFAGYTKLVSASKPEAAARNLLLFNSFLLPNQLNITLHDGQSLQITRAGHKHPLSLLKAVELDTSGKHPHLIIRSFSKPEFEEQALSFLSQLDDHSPLILDLRGNGGGNTPRKLMQKLCLEPILVCRESTPQVIGLEKAEQGVAAWQNGELSAHHNQPNAETTPMRLLTKDETFPASATPFWGELIILIDVGSGSATEDLLIPLKHSGRATIVGEASAGSTGQPYFEASLPKTQLTISAKRADFPDGTRFEGVGIQPDYPVMPTPEDIRHGNDPALMLAQQLLRQMVSS
ncbi:S41 family peptidase [Pseudovibrio ascidiaceicola]|uniref:S41 family peptidase n=1 Tax=Pseudovibrio ascidiaceicola TaxID=285279 RepID=UPI000D68BDEB|nr:S41 family peptidase [Pseudovibrio ascidiaceicola]